MKNQDRRNIYTETIIKQVVLGLLKKKPIYKITVAEVCRIADINRGTFYLHYTDCQNVLKCLQDDFSDKLIAIFESHKHEDGFQIILVLNQALKENKEDYLLYVNTDSPITAFDKFINYTKTYFMDRILKNSNLSREEADWIIHYIIGGSFAIKQRFINETDINLKRDQILHNIVTEGLFKYLKVKEL